MYMYKGDAEAVVTKQQVPAMEKCGWCKTKNEAIEASGDALGKEDTPLSTDPISEMKNESVEVEEESISDGNTEKDSSENEMDKKPATRQSNRGKSTSNRGRKPSITKITKK